VHAVSMPSIRASYWRAGHCPITSVVTQCYGIELFAVALVRLL